MFPSRNETPQSTVVTVQELETCPVIIRLLAARDYGFNELDRSIEGISRRMLTRRLRISENEGFVSRTARAEAPFRVQYALTELGRSLRDQLLVLGQWALAHNTNGRCRPGQKQTERRERHIHAQTNFVGLTHRQGEPQGRTTVGQRPRPQTNETTLGQEPTAPWGCGGSPPHNKQGPGEGASAPNRPNVGPKGVEPSLAGT